MDNEQIDNFFKIIVVGDAGVGKTNLIYVYDKGRKPLAANPTIGVEFTPKMVNLPDNRRVRAQIWDTAGQEQFRAVTMSHYRGAVGALVVFDISNRTSFEHVKEWLAAINERAESTVQVGLIGHKSDTTRRAVGISEAEDFAKSHKIFYTETSFNNVDSIHNAFTQLLISKLVFIQELLIHKKKPSKIITENLILEPKINLVASVDILSSLPIQKTIINLLKIQKPQKSFPTKYFNFLNNICNKYFLIFNIITIMNTTTLIQPIEQNHTESIIHLESSLNNKESKELESSRPNHQEHIPREAEQILQKETENLNLIDDECKDEPQHSLKRVKSVDELKCDFKENEKILTSLSFNINDLFKKISSLTESVMTEIDTPPVKSAGKIEILEPSMLVNQTSPYKSETLISFKEPMLPLFQREKHEQTDFPISMKIFEIGKSLGHGKFGEVLSCRHKETGHIFALKKIFKSTIEQYQMSKQVLIELEASKKMNHPNIIKSYTSFSDEFHIFLLSEYAIGTKLTKKFKSSEQEVREIIKQVLSALKFMHSVGVVHRDLKPENIIVDEAGLIKVCDFGWSHLTSESEKMNILCGTLDYVSPEMVDNKEYTKEIDLWSVGVLTYELLFGIAPFKGENKSATFEKVKNLEILFPKTDLLSEESIDFIEKLLQPEENRLSLEECERHPFLTKESKKSSKFDDFNILFQ